MVVFSTPVAKFFLDSRAGFLSKQVTVKYGVASELKAEIERGAPCDVALLTEAVIDDLVSQGKLSAASRILVFKSGVGLAVRKGARLPPVRTAEELKRVLIEAKSLAIREGGAGAAISRKVFEQLGIAEMVAAKTVLLSSGVLAEAIVEGKAELGLCQISEIVSTEGARLHAPLPAELQVYSRFAAAMGTQTRVAAAAREFLHALGTPAARAELDAKGLAP